MKEILSAFGSEFFRPLVTILLPGAIAITPAFIALLLSNPDFGHLVGASHIETAAVLITAALLIGLICDDLGARVEVRWDKSMPAHHEENWYLYLRQAYRVEPVGQRYIRTLVMHLKFELGSSVGSLLAILGVWWWPVTITSRIFVSALLAGLAGYLGFVEGKASHKVLSRVRGEMLKGINVIPVEMSELEFIERGH